MQSNRAEVPRLVACRILGDERGRLGVVEGSRELGFDAKRLYFIFDTQPDAVRGVHAHKRLRQFIVCLAGSVELSLEGAGGSLSFRLDSPAAGVLVPPGHWRTLQNFAPGTVVAVLASEEYDEADYIRDYAEFRAWLDAEAAAASVPYLPLSRQHEALDFELKRAIEGVIRSGTLIGGAAVGAFEREFAGYCGAAEAVGCGNGLDALAVGLEALGIGPGDEVIVPANSFIASALAVSQLGAKPVLVDIDPATYSISVEAAEAAITPATKAIMPVHLYGIPADMPRLQALAQARDLYLVEDAAQAHGATIGNRMCGSFGDVAGFSFYPTKVLGALGDAGALTVRDPQIGERARLICNYGSIRKYAHEILGRNSRLDPIQAAVLSLKLTRMPDWLARRRALADLYRRELADLGYLQLPEIPETFSPAWHVFPVRVVGLDRDAVAAQLAEAGIGTNIHYPTPIHLQPAYTHLALRPGALPQSEAASREVLSIPLDPYHQEDEIARVIAALRALQPRQARRAGSLR